MQKVNWKEYQLSKLCLGTVQFGLNYGIANQSGQVKQEEVDKILDFVISKEINCLDTAKAYGNSESVIGNFIKKQKFNDFKVVSKVKSESLRAPSEKVCEEIELSIKNLFVDSLFGLLLHDSEILYNWNEKESLLIKKLKHDKLIENFGVSIYTDEEFNLAIKNEDVEIIQIPFNLFDQRAITKNWLEQAKEKNKLIFIRSVYLQGLILMDINEVPKYLNDSIVYIKVLDDICKKLNTTKNKLALSFVNTIASDSIILFGCDNIKQAQENVINFNHLTELDKETINYLKDSCSKIDEKIYNPTKWNKS